MVWFSTRRACGRCGRPFHRPNPPKRKDLPPTVPDVAARLRSWRLRLHLTQKKLGDRCGISHELISRYEDRIILPRFHNIFRLVKALGISMNDLLEPDPIMRELMRHRLTRDQRQQVLETVRDIVEADG